MDQDVKDKFEVNKQEHNAMIQQITNSRFELRILVAVLGILMSVIIYLLSDNVRYQKLAYKANIERYDYNHKLDYTIKGLTYKVNSLSSDVTKLSNFVYTINYKINKRDSIFYYNEYSILKRDFYNYRSEHDGKIHNAE